MHISFHVLSLPLTISALISLSVALLVLSRRNVTGGITLILLLLQLFTWAGISAVMWSLPTLQGQVFCLMLAHSVILGVPLGFLIFSAQIADNDHWLTWTNILLLALEPIITLFVIWAGTTRPLYFSSFRLITVGEFSELLWSRGSWFWVSTAYGYLLVVVSVILLMRALLRAGPYARLQVGTVLIGSLLPWGVNIYTLFFQSPSSNFDLTPLSAAAAALIFAYALFRQRLLDILPVARGVMIEKMADGVLVLDRQGRILDVNPAAQRILLTGSDIFGRDIRDVHPMLQALMDAAPGGESNFEVQSRMDPSRTFDVSVVFLLDRRDRKNGRLITFRDVTEHKLAENELQKMNARLQRQIGKISRLRDELQDQAIRDPLTGLFNRRYLQETLNRELNRARRGDYPISVVMMDLDDFKQVNDTYGHKAGDQALRSLGEIIRSHIRESDIACRFGGEEFVLVLPETNPQIAGQRAEHIRREFQSTKSFKEKKDITPTLSAGVAAFPANGKTAEIILDAADQAMYAAKARGGNATFVRSGRRKSVPV